MRKRKELELQILTEVIRSWEGDDIRTLGNVIYMSQVLIQCAGSEVQLPGHLFSWFLGLAVRGSQALVLGQAQMQWSCCCSLEVKFVCIDRGPQAPRRPQEAHGKPTVAQRRLMGGSQRPTAGSLQAHGVLPLTMLWTWEHSRVGKRGLCSSWFTTSARSC